LVPLVPKFFFEVAAIRPVAPDQLASVFSIFRLPGRTGGPYPPGDFKVTDDDLSAFIAHSIGSVWTLELLILLKRDSDRGWDEQSMIRELRSSPVVVQEAIQRLQNAGLVMRTDEGLFRYQAASVPLDKLANEIAELYATKPMAVIKAVIDGRTDKLRAFSDAFKLKE
jgi:hypothetical protein